MKALSFVTVFLLLVGTVFAAGQAQVQKQEGVSVTSSQMEVNDKLAKNYSHYIGKSNYSGLRNAVLRVQNKDTRQHLLMVLSKIENKTAMLNNESVSVNERVVVAERLAKLSAKMSALKEIVVSGEDNNLVVEGKEQAKFLGLIPVSAKSKFVVSSDGSMIRKRSFIQNFMSFNDDEVIVT